MREAVKERLIKHIRFLEEELRDYEVFKDLSWEQYNSDRNIRRNVERWIENIVNSSIDISKLILTLEGKRLGETYREMVSLLSLVEGFDKADIERIAGWVALRNIIAHEYLDLRWNSIKRFIDESEPIYRRFLEQAKEYLKKLIERR